MDDSDEPPQDDAGNKRLISHFDIQSAIGWHRLENYEVIRKPEQSTLFETSDEN